MPLGEPVGSMRDEGRLSSDALVTDRLCLSAVQRNTQSAVTGLDTNRRRSIQFLGLPGSEIALEHDLTGTVAYDHMGAARGGDWAHQNH